jgi:hypothetical protein
MKEGFLVYHPSTAEGHHQGQDGVEPGRDGEEDHVQHQGEESGVSGTYQYILLLHVVVKELGEEPRGPHQLDHGGGGVVGTHLGPRDVPGGVKDLLHHIRSKRRFAELLS